MCPPNCQPPNHLTILACVPTPLPQRDKFQRDFGIVRQTQVNIETQLEALAVHHKEQSGHMRKVGPGP